MAGIVITDCFPAIPLCYPPFMGFLENMALLRNPGDNEIPGTIYDDLTADYDAVVSGSQEKVAQVEAANAELLAEVARLKALNFDLLMAASGEPSNDDNNNAADESSESPTIDTLFDRE